MSQKKPPGLIKAALPILAAMPALGSASNRVTTSSVFSKHQSRAVVYQDDAPLDVKKMPPTQSNSAFAHFASAAQPLPNILDAEAARALEFLQAQGLFNPQGTSNASLSGDLKTRKQFAHFTGVAHCHINGSIYYTTSTVTNQTFCQNIGGTWSPGSSNNAPTNIGLSSTSINDSNTGTAVSVGTLSTTDADGGDSHTYSLVTNGASNNGSCGAVGDDDNSSFQIGGSQLQTASSLSAGSYNVCVQTHDGTTSYQKTFSITVNQTTPQLTSATYNHGTGALVVTGSNFYANGGGADVDVSKLTLTGEGGATYILAVSSDVEIDSATQFTVTLSGEDLYTVNGLLNKNGTNSDSNNTYNLAAADDFITFATGGDSSDASNGLTVSNYSPPTITSASYNASSGVLNATGTRLVRNSGSANDVAVSMLTVTGENGSSYTLTSSDVEITSNSQFSITLSTTDMLNVNGLLNANGTSSGNGTTYNLAAADNWMPGAAATTNIADTSGNGITTMGVSIPRLTSATYNASTGVVVITGTNFAKFPGAANDLDVSRLTLTGDGNNSYTLGSSDVEISSVTSASVSLNSTDRLNLGGLLNANGNNSDDGTTYNLAALDNWLPAAVTAADISDTSGNSVTVSGIALPTITSATYDGNTGMLAVTGSNFVNEAGANNDVLVSLLTLTGQGGGTYTLTTSNVEITSATNFSVTLNATDQSALASLVNQNGSTALDGTTYNLAAADNWMAGAGATVDIADTTNGLTASNVADIVPPTGHSVSFDSGSLNGSNLTSVSFTFASAEVGTDYNYTISSSGGGSNVSNSGTISSANQQITGIDVSGLADGTLTLSVVLTDSSNNSASAVTDTATLDATAPALTGSNPADDATSVAYDTTLVLSFDDTIVAGASGANSIDLYTASDDGLVASLAADDSAVVISGSQATVTWPSTLNSSTEYYVLVGAAAFSDANSNFFVGISSPTALSFTTGNEQAVLGDDTAGTNEDTAVAISVLANDSDSDGTLNAASVTVVSGPSNGSTSVNTGTGVITYTPAANYNGSDSFTYTVEDNEGLASNAGTVNITVAAINDAPVAVADLATTAEDNAVAIDVAGNDTDIDNGDAVDATSVVIVTQPASGSAVVNGSLVDYTPDANFNGSDSFTYTIDDGNGGTSNVATVTINVTGVNDLPSASDDSASVDEDGSVPIDVLANDSDIDGSVDATTVVVQANPSNGATTVDAITGEITYTPVADFNGSDSFTYTVMDDAGGTSNAATVTVTVNSINDAPEALDDTAVLLEDAAISINVLGNDSDVDGTVVAATVQVVTAASDGVATVNAGTGAIVYTPDVDYFGSDSFSYRVQDNLGTWSAPATVAIDITAVNDPPLANADSFTLDEDSATTLAILANDSDVDGSLDIGNLFVLINPEHGTVTDNGDGTLNYVPDADYYGSDQFSYVVLDNDGFESQEASVGLTINPVNDGPTISGTPATSVAEGAGYTFTPVISDPENDNLFVSATGLPSWLTLNSSTGQLTGSTSDVGSYDAIVLTVSDGQTSSSLAAFSIFVGQDTDGDGIGDSLDEDDDNDGMSDSFEDSVGFDPLDPSDAGEDIDGDNVTNLQEFLEGTDPFDSSDYVDTTAPVVTAPATQVFDATGLFTAVTLRQLLGLSVNSSDSDISDALAELASDNVDGAACCATQVPTASNGQVLLPPGSHSVQYRAADNKGNVGTATQVVNIRPLVSMSKDQVSVEGADVQFKVILNGLSPFYPLRVPYVIDSASTATDADHDLIAGSVLFQATNGVGETEQSVSIHLLEDDLTEAEETLIVRLDDRTSAAQDLADGYNPDAPNIYDINAGVKTQHTISIVEGNLAPQVSLLLTQGSNATIQVTPNGGPVTVTAAVVDPNPDDGALFDWAGSDSQLADNDGNLSNASFVFDPSALAAGRHVVQVTVADSAGEEDTARLYFRVVARLPQLAGDVDSDGDGVDDSSEGVADSDDDGIPDYLDNITASNVLPEQATETNAFLMECDPGVRCRLGQFSLLGSGGGARLNDSDFAEQPDLTNDTTFTNTGGVFDFEIHDLPTLGQSVNVVLPQIAAIPENGVYRKFQNGNWQTFVENANNAVHSAAGVLGYCPPPGDDAWQPGLVPGYYCVQLTIEDGGANDADGQVNGSVEDPGGVGVDSRVASNVTSHSGGSGSADWLFVVGLAGLGWHTRRRRLATAAAAVVASASLQANAAPDWLAQSYITVGVYQAKGSQSESDFVSGLSSRGIATSINKYDTERSAWQINWGYQYADGLSIEVGYLDLGDADVNFSALSLSSAALTQALEKEYPVSGEGITLGHRFSHQFNDRLGISLLTGVYWWEGEINTNGADVGSDLDGGLDPIFGLAGQVQLTPTWDLQLQVQQIVFSEQQVQFWGLAARHQF